MTNRSSIKPTMKKMTLYKKRKRQNEILLKSKIGSRRNMSRKLGEQKNIGTKLRVLS